MRYLVAALSLVVPAGGVLAEGSDGTAAPPGVRATVDRGVAFLAKDALAWKSEHQCISCHHAALVVWSMEEAAQRGIAVDKPVLAELTQWVAGSGDGKTGIERPPGRPKALNTKAVYVALALEATPHPDAAARDGLRLLLKTVMDDQIENGSWVAWPDTRPPIFGGSDDTVTALATLALIPAAAAGDEPAKAAREKGLAWLAGTKSDDDPQSLAMRLVLWKRMGRPAPEWEPIVQRIRERQNPDGGWSQAKDMASDAWATGQALYAISHAGSLAGSQAGAKPDDPPIERARAFLVKTQRDDGSWPMTSRPMPTKGDRAKSLIPITCAGSAWAILGLVRTL